jgi:uncharacterized protein (DUF1800 family)
VKPTRRSVLAGGVGWALLGGCGGELGAPHVSQPTRRPVPPLDGEPDLAGHVLERCTFGRRPGDRERLLALAEDETAAVEAWLARQLAPERIDDAACERKVRRLEALALPAGELYEFRPHLLLADLTRAKLLRAVHSERQLYEVLCELWSDHFNIDISKGECAWLKVADDRDVVRRHALGRFADLLRASALSPAMLWYLDGRENAVRAAGDRPNENYARELLELHTLGVDGGYTQRDVMELARCLTGWTSRGAQRFRKASVEFHAELHDDGEKLLLGERIPSGLGAGDLDRALEILARHPATARHVARKLCRRFLGDGAEGEADVAAAFASSGGELRTTLEAVFHQPAFRAPTSRGAKLKRPFHFVAACLRATGARTDCGPAFAEILARMGHAPFQCPTPDGFPEEATAWTGTLLWRWRLASQLSSGAIEGTSVDVAALELDLGGREGLLAHLLGRAPNAEERELLAASGDEALALALASPAFQRC